MERLEFQILREAAEEIDEAFEWYLRRSPSAADRFMDAVQAALEPVAERPSRWAPYPGYEGTRRCKLREFPYDVVVRVRGAVVEVVAVAHHKQRPGYWEGR